MLNNYAESELELMIGKDEKILWKGRPNKKCFILESIFNPKRIIENRPEVIESYPEVLKILAKYGFKVGLLIRERFQSTDKYKKSDKKGSDFN